MAEILHPPQFQHTPLDESIMKWVQNVTDFIKAQDEFNSVLAKAFENQERRIAALERKLQEDEA